MRIYDWHLGRIFGWIISGTSAWITTWRVSWKSTWVPDRIIKSWSCAYWFGCIPGWHDSWNPPGYLPGSLVGIPPRPLLGNWSGSLPREFTGTILDAPLGIRFVSESNGYWPSYHYLADRKMTCSCCNDTCVCACVCVCCCCWGGGVFLTLLPLELVSHLKWNW